MRSRSTKAMAIIRIFLPVMASLFFTTGSAGAAESIVKNGGFESGAAPWWGSPGSAVVGAISADGTNSLRVPGGYMVQQGIPVAPGQRYRIAMQVRADDAPEGSVFVQLSYRGDTGLPLRWWGPGLVNLGATTEPALFATGSGPWRTYAVVVEAPALANQMLLYLRKREGTAGVAYYDSVTVTPTTEPVSTAASIRRIELAQRYYAGTMPAAPASVEAGAVALSGVPQMRVFASRSTDVVTLGAAGELATYLSRITGGNFLPLANDDTADAWPLIVVGREAAVTRGLVPAAAFNDLGSDGFLMQRVGKHFVLAGATPRGTLNAVYWFLDRRLGVRWLAPDATHIPQLPTIQLTAIDERHVPRFAYREVHSAEGGNKVLRAHNLLNGESHGFSFSPTTPELDVWSRSWATRDTQANFHQLVPQAKYGAAHPDWYAGGQLAMMDSGVREAMAQAIIARLRAVPDYRKVWFQVDQMDWGWSMDAASANFAAQHGGAAGPRVDMMNDVVSRVQKALPGALLGFNAYQWSFPPPSAMEVSPDLLVVPMTLQVDYSTPLNAGRNQVMGAQIARWNELASQVLLWDHVTNFAGFIQPTPNIYPIAESLRWLATLPRVIGYFAEGSWDTPGAEFASLRLWLIARLLWNPELDPRALVADYCATYFGKGAGPYVARYIDLMHSAATSHREILAARTTPDAAMYDLAFIRAADALFDQAEQAADGDASAIERVRAARMGVDFLALVRRSDYAREAARSGSAWQTDVAARTQRLKASVKAVGLTQYRQGGGVDELMEMVGLERKPSAAPSYVANLAATDWAEISDLALWRFESARLVADPAASDGVAARMSGASPTWAIQARLDKLPPEGTWDVFVDLRVEPEASATPTEGVRVGSTPPTALSSVPASAVSGAQYRRVKLPGGPFRNEFNVQKAWFVQAPANKTIRYVYVDRLVAVRAGLIQ